MEEQKDYRISFFKPTTPFSKTNRNLVITLVLIWAIAVFGFQILLRVMEKPTPEKTLITFDSSNMYACRNWSMIVTKTEIIASCVIIRTLSGVTFLKSDTK